MNRKELVTILANANTIEGLPVRVRISYPDGTFEYANINSFNMCTDAISLNVISTVGFDTPEEPNLPTNVTDWCDKSNENKAERTDIVQHGESFTPKIYEASTDWQEDSWNSTCHIHNINVGDCIEYENGRVNNVSFSGILIAKSFDCDGDWSVRAYIDRDDKSHRYVKDVAPGLTRYRFAPDERLFEFFSSMPTDMWDDLPLSIKERYKEYRY